MEKNEEKMKVEEESEELTEIANEIDKLSEEVKVVKEDIKNSKRKREKNDQSSNISIKKSVELNPIIDYISDLLENSSEQIVSEIKSEFFRLFNFLSSMVSITPNQIEKRTFPKNETSEVEEKIERDAKYEAKETSLKEKEEMFKLLLDERESLIYELSDQVVAIESERKELQDNMKQIETEKIKWVKQKSVLERLVTSDPRFNIISLLRRMGVIAPIQLSFVLGVSLSQTKKYIYELERMKILQVNEDETVSLHPAFDEDTMNIRIDNEK